MKLVYDVHERPPLKKNLVFAFQQVLAIMAATILVPILVNSMSGTSYLSQPAALCGAGFGTLYYLLVTKRKSPVFLGSSFAFISPLIGATSFGFLGIFLGAVFAGSVYLAISIAIKKTGTNWVNKLLPPVVIGPTVALIGLSLCGSAVTNITNTNVGPDGYSLLHIFIGIFAFMVTVWASVKGSKSIQMIPFIIGVLAAYALSLVFTLIGKLVGNEAMQMVNLAAFDNMTLFKVPQFTFLGMFGVYDEKLGDVNTIKNIGDILNIFMLFAPVAFVTLAEHIADHKNLSTIIGHDLITDPGLDRTLNGDGVGSIVGSFFGGCPNTTYGESVGCVAISGCASVSTIIITSIYCIVLSFFDPFVCFVNSIPSSVIGGICIALYGFIAVSGLKMLQPVDLNDNRNLFVVAGILVTGIGGLTLNIGVIQISSIATALIVGILVNTLFNRQTVKMEEK
ncbi:MAG: uracil-xanthine permease family protein [Christensenellales bacterium]